MSPENYSLDPSAPTWRTPATGFGGLRERVPRLPIIVVSGDLSVPGTSSAGPSRVWEQAFVHQSGATTSGFDGQVQDTAETPAETTRKATVDLRRLSGLTWEQLGELFEVSRRSVHFWASGKPLNAANEQRLMRVLDIVRKADRGDARSTRAALFEVTDGSAPFDLLVSQKFDEARSALGPGPGRRRPGLTELGAEAKAARKPLPPGELVDARHDRVHRDVGRGRPARTARNKPRGSS